MSDNEKKLLPYSVENEEENLKRKKRFAKDQMNIWYKDVGGINQSEEENTFINEGNMMGMVGIMII